MADTAKTSGAESATVNVATSAGSATAALLNEAVGDDDDDEDEDFVDDSESAKAESANAGGESTAEAPASTAGDDDSKSAPTTEATEAATAKNAAPEEESSGTVAYLRGKLRMEDDDTTVVFSGVWASTKEDFADKAKTSKIRYETSLTRTQFKAGDLGETSWDGYFLLNEGKDENDKTKYRRIREDGIEFGEATTSGSDFVNVKGHGDNEFGAFSISGIYNRATRQFMITKQYEADDDDIEDDRTEQEKADELALLREEATMDISLIKSGAHLKKRKATGESTVSLPFKKRERRQTAIRAQNRWRDEIAMHEGNGAKKTGDNLLNLTTKVKSLRKKGTAQQLMPLLRALAKFEMTVAELSRTKVGAVINKLAKKHSDVEVKRIAIKLVKKWREAAAKETTPS